MSSLVSMAPVTPLGPPTLPDGNVIDVDSYTVLGWMGTSAVGTTVMVRQITEIPACTCAPEVLATAESLMGNGGGSQGGTSTGTGGSTAGNGGGQGSIGSSPFGGSQTAGGVGGGPSSSGGTSFVNGPSSSGGWNPGMVPGEDWLTALFRGWNGAYGQRMPNGLMVLEPVTLPVIPPCWEYRWENDPAWPVDGSGGAGSGNSGGFNGGTTGGGPSTAGGTASSGVGPQNGSHGSASGSSGGASRNF